MPIKTGRTRTLTATGTIAVSLGTLGPTINGFTADLALSGQFCPVAASYPPFFGHLGGWQITYDTLAGGPPYLLTGRMSISGLGLSGSVTPNAILTSTTPSGSYTWSVDVEEISTFVANGRASYWIVQEQPKVGGTIAGSITFNGSTASFSGTITPSMVITLGDYIGQGGHAVYTSVAVDPGTVCLDSTVNVSVSPVFMGQSLGTSYSHTYTIAGSQTAVVDFGSGIDLTVGAYGTYVHSGAQVNLTQQVTKQATLTGQVNAFEIAYPTSLVLEYAAPIITSPVWTTFNSGDTASLDNYSSLVQSWSVSHPAFTDFTLGTSPQLAQGDGFQARINPSSLATAGESNTAPQLGDGILRARLNSFNALTIWQSPSVTVDPCTSTTGWTANTSIVGGYIQVDSSSLGGIAQRSFYPSTFSTEGYRYLQVVVEPNFFYPAYNNGTTYAAGDFVSSGGVNYECILATVGHAPPNATYWLALTSAGNLILQMFDQSLSGLSPILYQEAMGAAGSATTITFDLIAPYAGPVGYTAFTTRVLDSKYVSGQSAVGPGWGIDNLATLGLEFPPGSGTYAVKGVTLIANSAARVSFIQSDNRCVDKYQLPPTFLSKFALADTDGKRSFEIGDQLLNPPYTPRQVGAGPTTFIGVTSNIKGWNVTPNVSSGDAAAWYYDNDLCGLAGAGAIYQGTAPTVFWFDKAVGTSSGAATQVPYQALANYVIVTPQMGDLDNSGAFGSPFAFYFWEFLRQRTTGVAIDITQAPIASQTVTESEVISGNASGSGTTNSAGRFITGDNYARTVPTQQDVLSGTTPSSGTISFPAKNRDILRIAFLGTLANTGGPGWHLQDDLARVHNATIVSGDVWYRRSDFTLPAPVWKFYNQVTHYGDCHRAMMGFEPATGILYMVIERLTSGVYNTYITSSTDSGASWVTPTLYMATSRPLNPFKTQMGGFGLAWFVYNSGSAGNGTIYSTVRNAGDTSWPTPWQWVDQTGAVIQVQDGGWSNIDDALNDQQSLSWAPLIVGDTDSTYWYSTDNTKSWTKLT